MARSRNIKPGFFKNEDLAECTPWARLCFAGLWLLADREGRLEDRPKRIKGELFAYDSVEVDPLLGELEARGFLVRYRNEDGSFIQISRFLAHQTPHYSEKPSVIKPPGFKESWPDDDTTTPGGLQEDSKKEALIKRGSQPPDSLIPDSPIPSKPTFNEVGAAFPLENRPDDHPQLSLVTPPPTKPCGPPDCPHQAVLTLWAEVLPALPKHNPSMWRGARADHLRARWRETAVDKRWATEADGLAYFRRLFGYVGQSAFLTGRVKPREAGRPPFVIELEWLVNPTNWARVIEGKYHQTEAA